MTKVIARGVFRKNNPIAGKTETLNLADIVIASKQSRSLQILTDVDLIDAFTPVRTDLEKLSYALGILELIQQTIEEHHADVVFFDFTQFILDTLKTANQPRFVFIYFLLKLSSFLGFKPDFSACSVCNKVASAENFYFSIEKGTSYCSECAAGISMFQKFQAQELIFLSSLQKFPHRLIEEFDFKLNSPFNFIQFLTDYLSFHQGQDITLRSLNLIS